MFVIVEFASDLVNLLHHINDLHGPFVQCFYLITCVVGSCTSVHGRWFVHSASGTGGRNTAKTGIIPGSPDFPFELEFSNGSSLWVSKELSRFGPARSLSRGILPARPVDPARTRLNSCRDKHGLLTEACADSLIPKLGLGPENKSVIPYSPARNIP